MGGVAIWSLLHRPRAVRTASSVIACAAREADGAIRFGSTACYIAGSKRCTFPLDHQNGLKTVNGYEE